MPSALHRAASEPWQSPVLGTHFCATHLPPLQTLGQELQEPVSHASPVSLQYVRVYVSVQVPSPGVQITGTHWVPLQ
jgi:hypothetical protein